MQYCHASKMASHDCAIWNSHLAFLATSDWFKVVLECIDVVKNNHSKDINVIQLGKSTCDWCFVECGLRFARVGRSL